MKQCGSCFVSSGAPTAAGDVWLSLYSRIKTRQIRHGVCAPTSNPKCLISDPPNISVLFVLLICSDLTTDMVPELVNSSASAPPAFDAYLT